MLVRHEPHNQTNSPTLAPAAMAMGAITGQDQLKSTTRPLQNKTCR